MCSLHGGKNRWTTPGGECARRAPKKGNERFPSSQTFVCFICPSCALSPRSCERAGASRSLPSPSPSSPAPVPLPAGTMPNKREAEEPVRKQSSKKQKQPQLETERGGLQLFMAPGSITGYRCVSRSATSTTRPCEVRVSHNGRKEHLGSF